MKQPVPFINVTPLIDVLLVLLIIFMVISPKKPHRFESQIPEKPREDQRECETCLVRHDSRSRCWLQAQ